MSESPRTETPHNDPRVYFAAERTLLAWIRTGLALMGFGFVVARFGLFLREMELSGRALQPRPTHISLWFGMALVLLGVVVNLIAAMQHAKVVARLQQGTWKPAASRSGIAVALVLSVCGIAVSTYLLTTR